MNRRIFLKLTGIITILGIPTLAQTKKEPQWISFKDKTPKLGQKYIILFRNKQRESYVIAKAISPNPNYSVKIIRYKKCFSALQGLTPGTYYMFYSREMSTKEIFKYSRITEKWITKPVKEFKYREYRAGETGSSIIGENMYWLPIKKEIPTTFPPLPKLIIE